MGTADTDRPARPTVHAHNDAAKSRYLRKIKREVCRRLKGYLQRRVDRLALHGQDPEDTLVDAILRFASDKPAEGLDAESKLTQSQQNFGLVPARGFEPRTFGLKDRCSNQAELRRHGVITMKT